MKANIIGLVRAYRQRPMDIIRGHINPTRFLNRTPVCPPASFPKHAYVRFTLIDKPQSCVSPAIISNKLDTQVALCWQSPKQDKSANYHQRGNKIDFSSFTHFLSIPFVPAGTDGKTTVTVGRGPMLNSFCFANMFLNQSLNRSRPAGSVEYITTKFVTRKLKAF